MPLEFWRWELVERYHWTLDYVDTLSLGDLREWFEIGDARIKAAETNGRKNRR